MTINQNFAIRLKDLIRDRQSISTDLLGKTIGVSGVSVRMWRLGKTLPNLDSAIKLADYFNCSLDYLFGRSLLELDFEIKQPLPFYDSFISVIKLHNVSWYKIHTTTNIANTNLGDWREGRNPSIPTIITLANFLDCSIDYLIGRDR